MKLTAENVGVDAGLIMICDEDYYKRYDMDENPDRKNTFDVVPGTYQVKWLIRDTWNGRIDGEGTVEITSGKMVVSDPCYWIEKDWMDWLDETNYGGQEHPGTIIINSMGGDGRYKVELNMVKV